MKQILVFRDDLRLSTGKKIVQGAHASIGAYIICKSKHPNWIELWEKEGQKKVAVRVPTLEEMLELYEQLKREEIPVFLVRDAGLTEVAPATITSLGIGPVPDNRVDRHTRDLKLV